MPFLDYDAEIHKVSCSTNAIWVLGYGSWAGRCFHVRCSPRSALTLNATFWASSSSINADSRLSVILDRSAGLVVAADAHAIFKGGSRWHVPDVEEVLASRLHQVSGDASLRCGVSLLGLDLSRRAKFTWLRKPVGGSIRRHW